MKMEWLKKAGRAAWGAIKVAAIELLRISPAIAVAVLYLATRKETAGIELVFTILAAVAIVLAFAHITRRALFPYLDLKGLVDQARTSPGSSAAVILGVLCFLAFLVHLTITIALGAH